VLAVALSESPRRVAGSDMPSSGIPGSSASVSVRKAFPWFLFGFFVLAGLNSAGLLDGAIAGWMGRAGKLFMLIGMAGVGLNTNLGSFRAIGLRPLLVGLIGSVVVAVVSVTMIRAVLGGGAS
jgi:uncharacterized membrane protein YadS